MATAPLTDTSSLALNSELSEEGGGGRPCGSEAEVRHMSQVLHSPVWLNDGKVKIFNAEVRHVRQDFLTQRPAGAPSAEVRHVRYDLVASEGAEVRHDSLASRRARASFATCAGSLGPTCCGQGADASHVRRIAWPTCLG